MIMNKLVTICAECFDKILESGNTVVGADRLKRLKRLDENKKNKLIEIRQLIDLNTDENGNFFIPEAHKVYLDRIELLESLDK